MESEGNSLARYICHQRPERSFKFSGRYMPICARCTGFYPGILIGILLCFLFPFLIRLDALYFFFISIVLMSPMGLDGLTQLWKLRTSNNGLRFITGIMGGTGAGLLFGRIIVDLILI
jgi:uncharacterized membrane protein